MIIKVIFSIFMFSLFPSLKYMYPFHVINSCWKIDVVNNFLSI